jgi:hypothetical protein
VITHSHNDELPYHKNLFVVVQFKVRLFATHSPTKSIIITSACMHANESLHTFLSIALTISPLKNSRRCW